MILWITFWLIIIIFIICQGLPLICSISRCGDTTSLHCHCIAVYSMRNAQWTSTMHSGWKILIISTQCYHRNTTIQSAGNMWLHQSKARVFIMVWGCLRDLIYLLRQIVHLCNFRYLGYWAWKAGLMTHLYTKTVDGPCPPVTWSPLNIMILLCI